MLMNGYNIYGCSGNTDVVFEFMLTYARRIRSDKEWTKILKNNPEKPFLCFITPSDIAFVQVLMMNGMGVWDQARRMKEDPTCTSAEKKEFASVHQGRRPEKREWKDCLGQGRTEFLLYRREELEKGIQ